MAKFSEDVRRVGGGMEPRRGIRTRRSLLPQEAELCNFIGLSEDEYFHFLDLPESHNNKRAKAYDLVPDIVNADVALQLAISIVVGIIQNMLAPKPKAPKTPPSLTTDAASGPARYAPQQGFDSVQDLAKIGETVPLVFANRQNGTTDATNFGGVRVNARLLWSQMRSLSTGQQLKAIFMLSGGTLGDDPDFSGYSLGDTTLENYTNAKLALYANKNGGRLTESDRYDEGTLDKEKNRHGSEATDPFSVDWDYANGFSSQVFSGARSPSTQTQFGAFSPMSNSMAYRVPYELVLKGKDLSDDNKADVVTKRAKLERTFPRYASIVNATNSSGSSKINATNTNAYNYVIKRLTFVKDDVITYKITNLDPREEYKDVYKPWGVEDVKSGVDSDRTNADTSLAVGDLYLLGEALAVATKVTYSPKTYGLWLPSPPTEVEVEFKVVEGGEIDIRPESYTNPSGGTTNGLLDVHFPYELLVPQRAAIATVTNTRTCDATEIGIKSEVWKQISGFANANSHPGSIKYDEVGVVKDYEDDNGNIQLGQISKYINRLSFFRLFGRAAGNHSNNPWVILDGGVPFCVKGNTPQPQYNFIRINHKFVSDHQYEFKLVPYPGNLVKKNFLNKPIRLLQKNKLHNVEPAPKIKGDSVDVFYSGDLYALEGNKATNPEWYLGSLPDDPEGTSTAGATTGFEATGYLSIPSTSGYIEDSREYDTSDMDANYAELIWDPDDDGDYTIRFYYDDGFWGSVTGNIDDPGLPSPDGGFANSTEYVVYHKGYRYSPGNYQSESGSRYYYQIVRSSPGVTSGATMAVQTVSLDASGAGEGTGLTIDVTVYLTPQGNQYPASWKINSPGTGYKNDDYISFTYNVPGGTQRYIGKMYTESSSLVVDRPWPEGNNLNPFDAISDFYLYDAERSSHLNGPEHEIVVVNELVQTNGTINYKEGSFGIALAGLRINSSKEWSNFSQLSAYIKRGVLVENLFDYPGNTSTSNKRSSNLFPEIAYYLLTSTESGAGNLIGATSVERSDMAKAAKFCAANGFYWDGVITEKQNLREFIFEQASYCFLDFVILGGKFSLRPTVPITGTHQIDFNAKPTISALFTDGNMRDLKVAWLTPEERQLFKANIIYRDEKDNGFPETKVYSTRLISGSASDPIETFDFSNFCTRVDHAEKFAKYALKVRELVDHGINFSTTPTAAAGLQPGQYIRVVSEATHTSRFSNGSISNDGSIQSSRPVTNGMSIYSWKPGDADVTATTLNVSNGKATNSSLFGCVFTENQTETTSRCYKVEEITFDDEGFIEVAGSYVPLTSTGTLKVLEWSNQFI